MVFLLCAGAYLGIVGVLLWVTRFRRRYYTAAKTVASLGFVAFGVLCWLCAGRPAYTQFGLLCAALVLCAGGDVLLGVANRARRLRARPFAAGAILFLLAHLLFLAWFYLAAGVRLWMLGLPVLSLIVLWVLEQTGQIRLKRMRALGYLYTPCVAAMCALAIGYGEAAGGVRATLSICGSILFFVSDIILLFLYFGAKRAKALRYINLLTYYIGVFMLAGLAGPW